MLLDAAGEYPLSEAAEASTSPPTAGVASLLWRAILLHMSIAFYWFMSWPLWGACASIVVDMFHALVSRLLTIILTTLPRRHLWTFLDTMDRFASSTLDVDPVYISSSSLYTTGLLSRPKVFLKTITGHDLTNAEGHRVILWLFSLNPTTKVGFLACYRNLAFPNDYSHELSWLDMTSVLLDKPLRGKEVYGLPSAILDHLDMNVCPIIYERITVGFTKVIKMVLFIILLLFLLKVVRYIHGIIAQWLGKLVQHLREGL